MIDDHDLFERAVERFAPPEGSFERLAKRRERRHRNNRITAGVVALVVAAVGMGALVRALPSGTVPADDPSTTFTGTWNSTELEFRGSTQSMTIRPAEDGLFDVVLHDDSSFLCSSRRTRVDSVETPATMTGAGRLEDATTLVVPSPVLTCADGREPTLSWGYTEEGRPGYTLLLDRATDRLFDNLGVAWHRGTPPEDAVTAESGWTASMPGGVYSMLGGEITFQAPEGGPWTDHAEAYIDDRWFFLLGEPESGLAEGTSIDIVVNGSTEAPCEAPASIPASAETMIRAIRTNPDLDTTAPVVERIGGIEARRMDLAAVPGASTCVVDGAVPILSVPGRPWGDIENGERMRLYVLPMTGGFARSLVIMITAPEAAFERTVEAAAPVLDSFEFHAG
jgi:hypothetical protein